MFIGSPARLRFVSYCLTMPVRVLADCLAIEPHVCENWIVFPRLLEALIVLSRRISKLMITLLDGTWKRKLTTSSNFYNSFSWLQLLLALVFLSRSHLFRLAYLILGSFSLQLLQPSYNFDFSALSKTISRPRYRYCLAVGWPEVVSRTSSAARMGGGSVLEETED
jgi:hypothetical protein